MNTKYEFVEGDEKEVAPGVVVKRIRALVAIPSTIFSPAVKPGDLGGYIHQESNLQVYGNAWVYGNAKVYGNAFVCGNAHLCDDGLIFWASMVGTENGTLTVYNAKDNDLLVTRGWFFGTPAEFLAKSAEEHDKRTHREYSLLIEVATSRIEAARAELKEKS